MACEHFFHVGADATVAVQLLDEDGNIFVVPSTATVSGALVDPRSDQLRSGVKDILEVDLGNDWTAGIVAFQLTAAETAVLRPCVYGVEIKIVDNKTYRTKIPYAVEVIDTSIP